MGIGFRTRAPGLTACVILIVAADLDGHNQVRVPDLIILLGNWG